MQPAMWSNLCGQAFAEISRAEMLSIVRKFFVAVKKKINLLVFSLVKIFAVLLRYYVSEMLHPIQIKRLNT